MTTHRMTDMRCVQLPPTHREGHTYFDTGSALRIVPLLQRRGGSVPSWKVIVSAFKAYLDRVHRTRFFFACTSSFRCVHVIAQHQHLAKANADPPCWDDDLSRDIATSTAQQAQHTKHSKTRPASWRRLNRTHSSTGGLPPSAKSSSPVTSRRSSRLLVHGAVVGGGAADRLDRPLDRGEQPADLRRGPAFG